MKTGTLLLVVGFALVFAGPAHSQLKIFVEPAEVEEDQAGALWIAADFSGPLKTSIGKFVQGAQLVSDSEASDVILRHTATERSRQESTAKRVFVGRGAHARASAELIDSCGSILWSETAKDTSRLLAAAVGDFAKPGPAKVADRIANRLNEAIRKGKIRPCK